jgi:hypothetical protein
VQKAGDLSSLAIRECHLPLVLSTGIASLQTILGKIGKPAPMSLGPTPGVSKLIMLNEKGKIVYKRKNHIYCIYQFVIRA